MIKKIALKETQGPYSLSLDEAQLAEGPLILEREGQPVAAVIPIAEYERFRAWEGEQDGQRKHEEQLRILDRERAAFLSLWEEPLKTHRGQFAAILKSQVIDSAPTLSELSQRVYARYGCQVIYMTEVRERPRIYEFSSPEVNG